MLTPLLPPFAAARVAIGTEFLEEGGWSTGETRTFTSSPATEALLKSTEGGRSPDENVRMVWTGFPPLLKAMEDWTRRTDATIAKEEEAPPLSRVAIPEEREGGRKEWTEGRVHTLPAQVEDWRREKIPISHAKERSSSPFAAPSPRTLLAASFALWT